MRSTMTSPMLLAKARILCAVAAVISLCAITVWAQHSSAGGGVPGDAVGGAAILTVPTSHRSTATPARKRTRPARPANKMDADDYFDQGEKFREAKQYPEAITAYKKAIALNANFGDAYYELGWVYNDKEEYD